MNVMNLAVNFMHYRRSLLTLLAGAFLFIPSVASFSQEFVMACNERAEPVSLYKKVNESLTMGDTKLAINTFKKVIAFYKKAGRTQELPQNYLGMALSLAFNGNYRESIRYHKKALKAHRKYRPGESSFDIEMNLGLAYELAGKTKKSKRFLEKA
jgi:tetratricopeptide (TPR) repeat protein